MNFQNLISTHRKSLLTSVLCMAVIAASFLTLKSNSFRSMWSLANSNVEAMSISENYCDFRYIGYIDAETRTIHDNGNTILLNECTSGYGSCMFDKWHDKYDHFSFENLIYACTQNRNDLLDKIKDICAEIQDEGGLMTAIGALFKK